MMMDPAKIEFNLCIRGDSDWLAPHETDFLRNMTAEENNSMSRAVKRAALAECKRLLALHAPALIKIVPVAVSPAFPRPIVETTRIVAVAAMVGCFIGVLLGRWLGGG